ncbi:hypothetical protein [Pectinatus frisingensis]|uniref:hypothetical protein n=1 Tax=Pectinatus frisingensis TaxID=865 RepID=UPI0018C5A19E|nr:hypothetical protein [Pectinatus frisingensis]
MDYEKVVLEKLLSKSNFKGRMDIDFPDIPQNELDEIVSYLEGNGYATIIPLNKKSSMNKNHDEMWDITLLKLTKSGRIYAEDICKSK